MKPLPCPFCGKDPIVEPDDPEKNGDAWGRVSCINSKCPVRPQVDDRIGVADERGSIKYKKAAIKRWNKRAL